MAVAIRVIPCLDVTDGRVVKGVNFQHLRDAGDPVELAARYNEQGADEITFLDISASSRGRETTREVVTRCAETFALTGTWGFQWAGIASDPVVDGFSGGAHLLDLSTGRTIEWISTSRWLAEGGAR